MQIIKAASDANLYHFTRIWHLEDILKDGFIKPSFDKEAHGKTISLTRNKNLNKTADWLKNVAVRITIDGRKLGQTHKIYPFNSDSTYIKRRGETEERVEKKIPIKYFKKVVLFNKYMYKDKTLIEVKDLLKKNRIDTVEKVRIQYLILKELESVKR